MRLQAFLQRFLQNSGDAPTPWKKWGRAFITLMHQIIRSAVVEIFPEWCLPTKIHGRRISNSSEQQIWLQPRLLVRALHEQEQKQDNSVNMLGLVAVSLMVDWKMLNVKWCSLDLTIYAIYDQLKVTNSNYYYNTLEIIGLHYGLHSKCTAKRKGILTLWMYNFSGIVSIN